MCSDHRLRRRRRLSSRALPAFAILLGLAVAGCGNKRPPKPPPRIVPVAATDLEVAQRGNELQFSFAYPAVTIGGLALDGLEAVELWRMTRPLRPPEPEGEEGDETAAGEEEAATEEIVAEEAPAAGEPPAAPPFLFRRPVVEKEVQAEDRVEVDPREFLALAELEMRIEGAELQAAISGDRVLLRLPMAELPPPDVPEDDREVEIFAVLSVSNRGLGSELSNLVEILPRTPPPAPSQIETRPTADGINVVWRSEDPAVGFRVYRRDAVSRAYGDPIAEPAPDARSHLDSTAAFDSSYVYTVTSVAQERPLLESALAAEREVKYEDRYPPPPPTEVIVFAEPGRVRVLWEPSDDDDLAGYLVYRRPEDGSGFDRLAAEPSLELEYLDTEVASGRRYSYYVSAVDRSGNESEASETVDVEVP